MNLTKIIYILFADSDHPRLKWLCKGFKHVECLTSYNDTCINLVPRFGQLRIETAEIDINMLIESVREEYTILKVRIEPTSDMNRLSINPFNLVNCVSTTKYLLGIWSFVQTPKQLYKKLLKMQSSGKFSGSVISVEEI